MDWHPLCEQDPFPGDVGAVGATATALSAMARNLQEQAQLLTSYSSDIDHWEGAARDAFAAKVGNVPSQIYTAYDRYDAASRALSPYRDSLDSSQRTARDLLRQAQSVQHDIDRYATDLHTQTQWQNAENKRAVAAQSDPSQGSPVAAAWPGVDNARQLNTAKFNLGELQGRLKQLQVEFAGVASNTAAAIAGAAQIDKDDNSLFGKIDHFVTDVENDAKRFVDFIKTHAKELEAISKVLGEISSALGVLALIPIPFVQEAAAFLSTVAAVSALVIDTSLMLVGEKSFKSWAGEALVTALPFAAKGVKALAFASNAAEDGEMAVTGAQKVTSLKSLMADSRIVTDAGDFGRDVKELSIVNRQMFVAGETSVQGFQDAERIILSPTRANTALTVVNLASKGTIGKFGTVLSGADTFFTLKDGADLVDDMTKGHAE